MTATLPSSNLKPDDRVVLFTTDAALSADGQSWSVPIHAWVHRLVNSRVRKACIGKALEDDGLASTPQTAANFDHRVQRIIADNKGDRGLVVDVAGTRHALPPTGPNGHASTVVELDAAHVANTAVDGKLRMSVAFDQDDDRAVVGASHLIQPQGVSVISDIDDTVKVTDVTRRRTMLDRTFFRDYEAVAGMADLYRRWASEGATLHFVSSSPWQLYEPLDAFMNDAGFPSRSLSLKLVRLKDRTLLDLFKKGTRTKPAQLDAVMERFPERRFVLVGDSGEQDPEVYGGLARAHPGRIARICIRNIDASSPQDARYREAFAEVEPDRWTLFDNPADLGPLEPA